jgi:4,5-dihydroxyphthalate decarboxylase
MARYLDPWPYSIEKNRVALEILLDYAFEQGLTARRFAIKEIFAAATLD